MDKFLTLFSFCLGFGEYVLPGTHQWFGPGRHPGVGAKGTAAKFQELGFSNMNRVGQQRYLGSIEMFGSLLLGPDNRDFMFGAKFKLRATRRTSHPEIRRGVWRAV